MNLAYTMSKTPGALDRLLSEFARSGLDQGLRICGVAQVNTPCEVSHKCDMDLQVLPDGAVIRISQSLGQHARGCRLDPAGLEQAVAAVERSLTQDPELLLINKFGKHESDGRGFRNVIAQALAEDIPVLVGVNGMNEDAFVTFAGGADTFVEPDIDSLRAWQHSLKAAA